jgi:hypothetical protein
LVLAGDQVLQSVTMTEPDFKPEFEMRKSGTRKKKLSAALREK